MSRVRGRGGSTAMRSMMRPGRAADQHLVGEVDGLDQAVGDEQHGGAAAPPRSAAARPHMRVRVCSSSAANGSSISGYATAHQPARDCDPLAHAAGS